jgi:transketolase
MLNSNEIRDLKNFATQIRIETMKQFKARGFGHVGGSLSIVETIALLYGKLMKIDPKNPKWEERDWLVMSKGHAGPALYAALGLKGFFDKEELKTLNRPGTKFPSHCDRNLTPGIDMSTGSLGQGMSTALGVAIGHKLQGKDNNVYVVLGDGEIQEGQVWEGFMFGAQRKLDNIIAFIDNNKKQLDGYTKDICDLGDLEQKLNDFNWHTQNIDGHDFKEINDAIEKAKAVKGKPSAIILNTIKGKGVKFAEEMFLNHHIHVTDEQVNEAIKQLENELE